MSSKTRTLYIVWGYTGEYADKQDWPVAAYRDKELAEEHRDKAQKKANEIEKVRATRYFVPSGVNSFDPDMRMDYNGTWYEVVELKLRTTLPEE